MKIREIKAGRWYETTHGIGECTRVGGTFPPSVEFNISKPFPRGIVILPPRAVLRKAYPWQDPDIGHHRSK